MWSGSVKTHHIHTPDCNEYEDEVFGTFRRLTIEELTKVAAGESLWPTTEPESHDVENEDTP